MPFSKGDIVEFNFSLSKGHEPAGRRPGLIVSSDEFNLSTSMTLICPITTADTGFPLHIRLPEELEEYQGFVATEQIRAFDLETRQAKVVAHLPQEEKLMRNITSLVKSYF